MFDINDIGTKYPFPTIDFKFLNRSNTSSIIKRFTVEVLDAEVDQTPVPDFSIRVNERRRVIHVDETTPNTFEGDASLEIVTTNNGWGPAKNLEIRLQNTLLGELFRTSDLEYNGELSSGSSETTIKLNPSSIRSDTFEEFHKDLSETARTEMEAKLPELFDNQWQWNKYPEHELADRFEEFRQREMHTFQQKWFGGGIRSPGHRRSSEEPPVASIPISELPISWSCHDIFAGEHDGLHRAKGWPDGWSLYLTKNGFVYHEHLSVKCMLVSSTTYCTILDPSVGLQTRKYPISREIGAGEAERFHIMIGASMSSKLTVRFAFHLNEDEIITSEEFKLKIWNTRSSRLEHRFRDGSELEREREELQSDSPKTFGKIQLGDREVDFAKLFREREIEHLKESPFPFMRIGDL